MLAHKATMPARHLQNINCNFPGAFLHFGLALTYDPCLGRLLANDNGIHHKTVKNQRNIFCWAIECQSRIGFNCTGSAGGMFEQRKPPTTTGTMYALRYILWPLLDAISATVFRLAGFIERISKRKWEIHFPPPFFVLSYFI